MEMLQFRGALIRADLCELLRQALVMRRPPRRDAPGQVADGSPQRGKLLVVAQTVAVADASTSFNANTQFRARAGQRAMHDTSLGRLRTGIVDRVDALGGGHEILRYFGVECPHQLSARR